MPIMVCSPELAKYVQKWPSEDFELLGWFVKFKLNVIYTENGISISLFGMLQITNDQKFIPNSL